MSKEKQQGRPRFGEQQWFDKWIEFGDCWVYTGSCVDGYGRVQIKRRMHMVHRAMWEMTVGPIPEGMTIDHMCRNRRCCNPEHLRVATQYDNNHSSPAYQATRKKKDHSSTHCVNGHEWTEKSTYMTKKGYRYCRPCGLNSWRKKREQRA